ncbi:hypothetical protein L249_2352 [Ophiocordyceps polyrhachis-furcata BCC 54312]|uniref:Uncharacterized protein n=1 Tax=Ophiocordyceps polyrhachis-furcata BCC 54312 TaxID=1330021 RepID=A0A367LPK8_9HYPO|nr:hypothetical protein L249_2352 [Ophiocordyceps polyrhachis-furcata BCC 54312]
MTNRHLAEALFGTLCVLELEIARHVIPVGVWLLRHVVEDGFDKAELGRRQRVDRIVLVGRRDGRNVADDRIWDEMEAREKRGRRRCADLFPPLEETLAMKAQAGG